ncbi:hypothetical protein WA026_008575 [Henosepilachna vigintioctopunctata]|uniref:Rab3 GTPase-activating protein non-catalytic subunit n=1 Tax=Henosepilachna vigintioctopunctata TaxID=420089 RepID=A0AAW1U8Y1_9CUCU
MSCQIRLVANIVDTEAIRRCLFPTDDKRGSDSWLQQCHISVSPVGDLIVLGKERRLVILTSRLDSDGESQFHITFSGIIHDVDNIKAVLCLPIVGETKSSHVTPDWTCILLGFDSGYVRVYMETSELLYEEQFHSECITNIKCQSQHNPRPDISLDLHSEEIYVQYQSNVCVVAGNQLFQYLRKCRAQLARVQAQSELMEITPPSMNIRKWGFEDQSIINDIAVIGLTNSNSFDHLLTASTSGGFECRIRSAPPLSTLVLGAGSKPFLGFHYAVEGVNVPVLSDVAKAVAYKLKSALPSWLTGNRPEVEKRPSLAVQPTDQMGCRFGLCDLQRTANSIILSSNRKLAAVSDSLGRVILIDTTKGVALRVLKGYRDAQCSFVQVPDERRSKHKMGDMVAHFLVIYAPKKGTIEIFSTQQCVKITTFSAMKYSRLIYVNYGLMGYSKLSKTKYVCQFTTVFIDNNGQIKDIIIPFHFSLSEKHNKRARDIHLYKKLRVLVKSDTFCENTLLSEALKTSEELQTIEIKSQLIQFLSTTKNVPLQVLLKCAQYFVNNLDEDDSNELVHSLKVKVVNITSIIKFYLYMLEKSSQFDTNDENAKSKQMTTILKLDCKEMKNLEKLMDLNIISDNMKQQELKVKFLEQESYFISEFLSVFDLSDESNIKLLPHQDEEVLYNVSEALFHEYIVKCKDYKHFQEEVDKSKIYRKHLIFLLINYWVNRKLSVDSNLKAEMDHIATLLYILVRMSEDIYNDNSVEEFWYEMRERLTGSNRPFSALTAAMLCKYVAYKIEKEKDMDNSYIPLDDDIEIWSKENIGWALLIGKLEDVALLNILIANEPKGDENCTLPKLPHDKVDVSLKLILKKKGSASEIVARWLTMSGIQPEYIVINEKINKPQIERQPTKNSTKEENEEQFFFSKNKIRFVQTNPMFQHYNMIRAQWPYSLDPTMILTNMSWEYALEWKKNIQNFEHLEACISCLEEIPNYHVKLGLFNLVWKTHLKLLFENIKKLINKVGKLPKAKLCQQDTGLSDLELSKFIKICTAFLNTLTNIAQRMPSVDKVELRYEDLWENGGQPLPELAFQQANLNYDLLLLHYQLSLVFSMFCTFSLKAVKPVDNLFDVEVINVFFNDFQEQPNIDFNRKHSKLTKSRIEFLNKVISSSVEAITVKDGNIYVKDHVYWNAKCILLGRIWDVDLDILRKQQVLQLFIHGYDSVALELLGTVADNKKTFGIELLQIAGKRLSKYLASCTELGFYLAALTPPVTNYIKNLDKDWVAESSLKKIKDMTSVSRRRIDENQYEHRLATYLLEGVDYLIKYESESKP